MYLISDFPMKQETELKKYWYEMVLRYQKLGIERNSFKYTKRTKKKQIPDLWYIISCWNYVTLNVVDVKVKLQIKIKIIHTLSRRFVRAPCFTK